MLGTNPRRTSPITGCDRNSSNAKQPSTAVAPDGKVTAFYVIEDALSPAFQVSDDTGVWPQKKNAPLSTSWSYDAPSVGFDAQGGGRAVWNSRAGGAIGSQGIMTSSFSAATGRWSQAADVPGTRIDSGDFETSRPAISVAPDGRAVVIWEQGIFTQRLQAATFDGTVWTNPETISGDLHGFYHNHRVDVVFDGTRFIAGWDLYDDNSDALTYTAEFDLNTGWSIAEKRQQSTADGRVEFDSSRLASDGRGTTFLIWARPDTRLLMYQRHTADGWGPITPVPGGTLVGAGDRRLRFAMNASGVASAVWLDHDNKDVPSSLRLATFY